MVHTLRLKIIPEVLKGEIRGSETSNLSDYVHINPNDDTRLTQGVLSIQL